ncbi:MAG: polyprenyl synthetase family protein [Neisseriaceae bacterium]|nr:polyprenyl synthetase family protein [Neisseriaceae bacterium]
MATWQKRALAQTELILTRYLPSDKTNPTLLHQAMQYALLGGGKRIRAMLVMAASSIGESDEQAVEQAVCAVEMIHAYSLVHDDLPSMDNDILRRGKPTCHVVFGEAQALLAGDALQTLAFDVLSRHNNLPAVQQLESIKTLAIASGSLGMAGGQSIDLSHIGQQLSQSQLETMHNMKTGALICAAVKLGALSCFEHDKNTIQALHNYATAIGLAFQVVDDILDNQSDSSTLGKTAGKDADNNKPTFVSLLGIDGAKTYAEDLYNKAYLIAQDIPIAGNILQMLAKLIIKRNY